MRLTLCLAAITTVSALDESGFGFGRWVGGNDEEAAFRELFEAVEMSMSMSMSYPPSLSATLSPSTPLPGATPVPTIAGTSAPTESPVSAMPSASPTLSTTNAPVTASPTGEQEPSSAPTSSDITGAPTVSPTSPPIEEAPLSCDSLPLVNLVASLEVETNDKDPSLDVLVQQITEVLKHTYPFCGDIASDQRRRRQLEDAESIIGDITAEEQAACTPVNSANQCMQVQVTIPVYGDTSEEALANILSTMEASLGDEAVQEELVEEGFVGVRVTGSSTSVPPEASSSGDRKLSPLGATMVAVVSLALAAVLIAVLSRKMAKRDGKEEDEGTLTGTDVLTSSLVPPEQV